MEEKFSIKVKGAKKTFYVVRIIKDDIRLSEQKETAGLFNENRAKKIAKGIADFYGKEKVLGCEVIGWIGVGRNISKTYHSY